MINTVYVWLSEHILHVGPVCFHSKSDEGLGAVVAQLVTEWSSLNAKWSSVAAKQQVMEFQLQAARKELQTTKAELQTELQTTKGELQTTKTELQRTKADLENKLTAVNGSFSDKNQGQHFERSTARMGDWRTGPNAQRVKRNGFLIERFKAVHSSLSYKLYFDRKTVKEMKRLIFWPVE